MTTATSKVDLGAPIWRLEEIATYLRLPSTKCAYRIVASPGFPQSVVPGKRNRRWLATEVMDALKAPKSEKPVMRVSSVEISSPKNITRNVRRRAA